MGGKHRQQPVTAVADLLRHRFRRPRPTDGHHLGGHAGRHGALYRDPAIVTVSDNRAPVGPYRCEFTDGDLPPSVWRRDAGRSDRVARGAHLAATLAKGPLSRSTRWRRRALRGLAR